MSIIITSNNQSGGITAQSLKIHTSDKPKKSNDSRGIYNKLGAVAAIATILTFLGTIIKEHHMNTEREEKISITSNNQSGGITAHTVYVNSTPEPKLVHYPATTLNKESGCFFHTNIPFDIDSPYPPGNLKLSVSVPSIKSMEIIPQRAGISISGHSGIREGMAFTNINSPFGRYHLCVLTKEPVNEESIKIEAQFS